MTAKNLLLGNGEELTTHSDIVRGGGDKKLPYTLSDTRAALANSIQGIISHLDEIDTRAKPRGEGVFMMTLHPAFLARSYFPTGLLQACGLRDIGSKQVLIKPRKVTNKKHQDKELATASLFVAGGRTEITRFQSFLFQPGTSKGLIDQFNEIESLSWLSAEERIKGPIPSEGTEGKFEIALHAREEDNDIISAFAKYAAELGMIADLTRRIQSGGLAFLPVTGSGNALRELAEFTFLRAARVMPEIRVTVPNIARSIISSGNINLPSESAILTTERAAIFDGGIGAADLSKWADEYAYPSTTATVAPLLMHGNEVTSTFLFGRMENGQTSLPRPYMGVDHFRVLGSSSGHDPDLFDVLNHIKTELDTGKYKLANLSLGPRMPIWDDEVHPWTSVLDQICARHDILATIAVGNDGDIEGANRIQPPSDMVNALAIGAADRSTDDWKRADYSCIGPGRSPGFVKPDGVAFGGSEREGFLAYNPFLSGVVSVCGTSYSAPSTLRTAAGLLACTSYPLSTLALKTLLVHNAEKGTQPREEIGWGRFSEDPLKILECEADSVSVVYQGTLAKGQFLRATVPFPNVAINGDVEIKATLAILAPTDPEHVVNYTRAGMEVRFRPRHGINEKATKTFFSRSTQYQTEQECREDGHKWETCLHHKAIFNANTLSDPVFDIEYHARQQSKGIPVGSLPDIRYAMAITVRIKGMTDLYNLIRQRYSVLSPINIRADIQISSQ